MARSENEEECGEFLEKLIRKLPFPPFFFTIDQSPQLFAAIRNKCPDAIIGYDYFHLSQSLNRALRKELMRLQRMRYNKPINAYKKARKQSLLAEKEGNLPSYSPTEYLFLMDAWNVFKEIHTLNQSKSLKDFNSQWRYILDNIEQSSWSKKNEIYENLLDLVPDCGFTSKNYQKTYKKACQIWRRIILDERKNFEDDKSDFIKVKYLVLKNPINMTNYDKKMLRIYLQEYPWIRPIREAIRNFHYQFRAPSSSWRPLTFLEKIIEEDSHEELKSVVNSFIKDEEHIFAYRQIWKKYPNLKNKVSIRSNQEQTNKKINMVARNQYGLRDIKNIVLRLEHILECPIIVSKDLLAHETNHL